MAAHFDGKMFLLRLVYSLLDKGHQHPFCRNVRLGMYPKNPLQMKTFTQTRRNKRSICICREYH